MGFLEKRMNEAMGWTNRDVSVEEMAALIEETVIAREDEYHLDQLKSAMKKSWVLMIGNGGSVRKNSFCEGKVEIVTEYSLLTRTMNMVQLWDHQTKRCCFIPKGRDSARALCDLVLKKLEK